MEPRRLLLVDENPDFLRGLEDWLGEQPGIVVAGRARSGREALEQIAALAPDIVLLDMALRDISGPDLARRIKSATHSPAVVLMTFHDSHTARRLGEAVRSDGVLVKSRITEQWPLVLDRLEEVRDAAPEDTPESMNVEGPPEGRPVLRRKP